MTIETGDVDKFVVPQSVARFGQYLPQVMRFQGFGRVAGGDQLEFIVADVVTSVRLPLVEAGRNIISLFILEREEDGDFLFTDHEGSTFGIGPSFREAFEDWHISASELLAVYGNHVRELSDHIANEVRVLEQTLDVNEIDG